MRTKSLAVAALALALTSCAGLDSIEEQQWLNLQAQGAPEVEEKSPTLAAVLNLALGAGDIYNGEWGAFVLDLLLWWPSVAWAVPQAAITANNINKRATIAYYIAGPGRGTLDPNLAPVGGSQ